VRAASRVSLPRPALAAALAVTVALVAAACGTGGHVSGGDVSHGKQVFDSTSARCSTCHTLAAAGAVGTVGPNLDNSFSAVRQQGFKQSTIQQVVADQIRIPLQGINVGNLTNVTPTGTPVMPANLVTGKDLVDVSAFVARCAGNPTDPLCRGSNTKITATDGKTIFTEAGCGSCHTLKDAGTTGTVGPNLDQLKPSFARVVRQVTNGGAVMPAFRSKLSALQIAAVARYVSSVAGK
jgi:mono/diheme cytochrome c family protein